MTILMCKPTYFDVEYDINPWMTDNFHRVDRKLAIQQWEWLKEKIQNAGEIVSLIEPVEGLPDMVFTANAATIFPTKDVVVSTFANKQRQPETHYWREYFLQEGYDATVIPVDFEGAGDALYDSNGHLWLGYGFRSDSNAEKFLDQFYQQIISLNLVDPRFYHLDTAFCPLLGGALLYFPAAFSIESQEVIKKVFGKRAIAVSDIDAGNFACNAVNVGDYIIMNKASDDLKRALGEFEFEVVETPMSEFIKSGGACKCLTLKLSA
jgi:N-dimethylarginine dimethylaminohydrolase